MPPLDIADEDRITKEEVELRWSRLKQRTLGMPASPSSLSQMESVKAAHLMRLAEIYPPRLFSPWWLPPVASRGWERRSRTATHSAMRAGQELYRMFLCLDQIYADTRSNLGTANTVSAFSRDGCELNLNEQFLTLDPTETLPPGLDESRFFHRLLRHWIYFVRQADPQCSTCSCGPTSTCDRKTRVSAGKR
jgi:hypothetical protein